MAKVRQHDGDLYVSGNLRVLGGIQNVKNSETITRLAKTEGQVTVVEDTLTEAVEDIATIQTEDADPNKLTPKQKQASQLGWNSLLEYHSSITNDMAKCGMPLTETAYVNYDSAYDSLYAYLFTSPACLSDLTTTSTIVYTTFASLWMAESSYRAELQSVIQSWGYIHGVEDPLASATKIPVPPVLTVKAMFNTAYLSWTKQANLGGVESARIERSDASNFSTKVTVATVSGYSYTEEGLALGGTADVPAARTYYYRVIRIVNGVTESSPSTGVSVAIQSLSPGAIAANAITQAKLSSAVAMSITDAQADASEAIGKAAQAQTDATAAAGNATSALGLIADIANDGKFTAVEKQSSRAEWDAIYAEKTPIETQATTFGITTEKTNYTNAYTALANYLNNGTWTPGATPPLWLQDGQLAITTDITGSVFRSTWKAYYDTRTLLLNAIAAKAKTLADAADGKAVTAIANAATADGKAVTALANAATADGKAVAAQQDADDANALLANIASDSKLTPDEKQLTRKEWDVLPTEYTENDAQAGVFGIVAERTAYTNAYDALGTYLNAGVAWNPGGAVPSYISDANLGTTTDITGSVFRSTWKAYYDARTTLLNAIAAKAKTLADAAQTQANTATVAFVADHAAITLPSASYPAGKQVYQTAGAQPATMWQVDAAGTAWLAVKVDGSNLSGTIAANNIATGIVSAEKMKIRRHYII